MQTEPSIGSDEPSVPKPGGPGSADAPHEHSSPVEDAGGETHESDAARERPELVIGLVAALGTRLREVVAGLQSSLQDLAGYSHTTIRLSALLKYLDGLTTELETAPEDQRYRTHMDAGDELRRRLGRDAMARLAMIRIQHHRREQPREQGDPPSRQLIVRYGAHTNTEKYTSYPGFQDFADDDQREIVFEASANLQEQLKPLLDDEIEEIRVVPEVLDPSVEVLLGHAWILRSLKHPSEVELLRTVYGSRFILIGTYTSQEARAYNLSSDIAGSLAEFSDDQYLPEAYELIRRDEDDLPRAYGQKTRDAFAMSDFFVAAGPEHPPVAQQLERIVRLLFGDTYVTPTVHEVAMMHAAAAARRSGSMARQVGASMIRDDGTLVATGCNDVPKAGGGLYWEGDDPDARDHQLGYDISDELRYRLLADLLHRLESAEWLSDSRAKTVSQDIDAAVRRLQTEVLRVSGADTGRSDELGISSPKSRVLSIIEYARAVHAEMAALTDAARHGVTTRGTHLYTTTFPCHECSRHIVAAGIASVTYVEPYPKSLARQLSGHAIALEEEHGGRVPYKPFVGVAPARYLHLFEALTRKDERGKRLELDLYTSSPRVDPADLDARFAIDKETGGVYDFIERMKRESIERSDVGD